MTVTHINIPSGHYIGQVRRLYARRWETVTGRCKSGETAMSKAAKKMLGKSHARVVFLDKSGWYEPVVVMECKR
jgi:hypothetical protein